MEIGSLDQAIAYERLMREIVQSRFVSRWEALELFARRAAKMASVEAKAVDDSVAIKTVWIDAPGSGKTALDPTWVETLSNDPKRFGYRLISPARRKLRQLVWTTS